MNKLPRNQRMAKLSMYSACQTDDCRCTGWKTPDESRKGDVENNYVPNFSEECRNQSCRHSLEHHISHLTDVTDEQTYELLGAVVDVENLYMSMHNEKDDDTKKVYYFLFRVSVILWVVAILCTPLLHYSYSNMLNLLNFLKFVIFSCCVSAFSLVSNQL